MKAYHHYLQASEYFIECSKKVEPLNKDYNYLSSILLSWIALESYINTVAETLSHGKRLQPHEQAFLSEKELKVDELGQFQDITARPSTCKKILFIINYFTKTSPADFKKTQLWQDIKGFEELRNKIIHTKSSEPIVIDRKKTEDNMKTVKDMIYYLNSKIYKVRKI